jgi:RNA recognition motif-containing protein
MGGVGSFSRQNRTLYVGKIKEGRNTAETVENHFEEFGDIERSESTGLPSPVCGC